MKTKIQNLPTANICINKSRVKIYDKESDPKVYLTNQSEFQIELFNPTSDTILAKIQLNGNQISQGGLVLRPGERVFLERYLDVAKKFKFDTYEVANTAEVRKAIEDNGDFKVEFYRESRPVYSYGSTITLKNDVPFTYTDYNSSGYRGINLRSYGSTTVGNLNTSGTENTFILNGLNGSVSTTPISSYYNTGGATCYSSDVTMDSFNSASLSEQAAPTKSLRSRSKTIETGRVEAGSGSNQKLEYVSKSFEYWPFHTVEYKLLPISQKVNTVADINVKRYCTNCGKKSDKTDKFCSQCGNKL